jgi:pyroglutamyl-peptidase
MNILVSGFDPFGNESINPSGEAVRRLASRSPSGVVVRAIELPTVFHRSWALLEKAVLESAPDAVICVGQADRRARISLERFAVNIMDARIPDNDGNQPRDQAIQDRGPQAYRSGLPLRAMEKALFDSGIPAHISDSAGTYVCNYIFYQLRHHFPEIPGGFVHVPLCTEQVLSSRGHVPFMTMDMIVRSLEVIIETVVRER